VLTARLLQAVAFVLVSAGAAAITWGAGRRGDDGASVACVGAAVLVAGVAGVAALVTA
jgi:hypothetical protein